MIIGYVVLETGGTPVLSEEFIRLLTEDKKTLFSGVLSAINNIFSEVFSSKLTHVALEKLQLYFGFGDRFVVILLSDVKDDRLISIANDIAGYLDSLEADYMELQVNKDLADQVKGKIREIIFKHPPPIKSLEELAKAINVALSGKKGARLGITKVIPKIHKPSILARIRRAFAGGVNLSKLVDLFYSGRLLDVVEEAPMLFDDPNYGELAKMLYVKAGLILNSFDPSIKAPSLDEIKTVIESISDEFSKNFLSAELESFLVLGAYNDRRKYFVSKQLELFNILSSKDERSVVYSIIITPLPYKPLLLFLEKFYKGRSDFLYALTFEMRMLLDILMGGVPENLTKALSIVGEAKRLFEEALKKRSPSLASYYHVMQFALVWSLFEKSLKYEDGVGLIKHFWEIFTKYWDSVLRKFPHQTNRHKAVNIFFAYNIIMRLLIEIGDEDITGKNLRKYKNELKEIIRWFIGLGETHRIMLDMYYVSLAGVISILSRIALNTNTFYEELPQIILDLSRSEMEKFWELNEYHYAHYYADILESIGNLAMFVDMPYIRQNILLSVAYGLERLALLFKDTPMLFYVESIKALRFYLLSKSDSGRESAAKLAERIKREASPFIASLVNRIFENYSGNEHA